MVEVLPPLTLLSPDDYYQRGELRKDILGSVGKVLKGIHVRIVDRDGRPCAPGIRGKIALKSDTISNGYLGNTDETQRCFRDGWFYTNDYGYLDTEDFLYVLGRAGDRVGETGDGIFAGEIEEKFYQFPFIARCAMIRSSTNDCFLFVSLREPLAEVDVREKLRVFCQTNLDAFLQPKDIIVKGDFPLTPLGKLDRRALLSEVGGK
jgi:acyl-coenzyme A synthetase/AMP-(fatty) acid ligase